MISKQKNLDKTLIGVDLVVSVCKSITIAIVLLKKWSESRINTG